MARIGINALYLIPGGVGGTEIYLRELLAALAAIDAQNEYFVFTNSETGADLIPQQANFHWRPQTLRARFRPARMLWEQTGLPLQVSRHKLDVLLNPGFTAPLLAQCRCVTVFHDLQHLNWPENFRWSELPFWRLFLWSSAHRSERLIAVSQSTCADLQRFYRIPPERVTVVRHGVERRFFELSRAHTEDFVLCVSAILPHKNHLRLIRAYARRKRDFRLVLVGVRNAHSLEVGALINELGLSDSIQLTGWIPRDELYRLYETAHALIYPSTFEGFGMPVLEGCAAGIPVACSAIAPLQEIGGDKVLFFDPHDEAAIADALDRIVTDGALRSRLTEGGPDHARGYSWEQSARETLRVLVAP